MKIVFAAMLCATLSACVPWTVRPLQEESSSTTRTPAAYVDSIWDSRLIPEIVKSATDAHVLLDAITASPENAGQKYGHREGGGSWYFNVKGQGRVISADTSSRNGTIKVEVGPSQMLTIQVGPVLRGTALRDSTSIIRFTDFTNQIEFADVSNELDKRALARLASFDAKAAIGHTVNFTGAFELGNAVIPVELNDRGKS
jgi:predicted lipoprotein